MQEPSTGGMETGSWMSNIVAHPGRVRLRKHMLADQDSTLQARAPE